MDVSKYPRDKIGLLIKISRMEQGLERAELSARTGINLSQLFRIENGQSVLNNYEIDILFDELLIDKKHFSQKDSYLNMIFDQYVDNYIYGLKLDNEINEHEDWCFTRNEGTELGKCLNDSDVTSGMRSGYILCEH